MANQALAGTSQHTSYSYFRIKGQTAKQIYLSLLTHAKAPGGHDAYATTSTSIYQKAKFTVGKSCNVRNHNITAKFKISLPQLNTSSHPPSVVKSKWQNFANVLKRHEEHHRSLWLACATAFSRKAQTLKASNCSTLGNNLTSLWKKIEAACHKQNKAFDNAEQAKLLRQPFIQMVLRGQ
jgi:predicted secreted Zn-dependent protease